MSFIHFSLHCFTENGIPLFTRNIGNAPSIPFPVIGSLNGIHMFGKNRGVELGCTSSENGNIYWKEYESIKFILIIVQEFCCTKYVDALLDAVYKSMIMSIGESELVNKSSNIERLKKKVKLCIPLLDSLLDRKNVMSTFTKTTEVLKILNANILKNYLTSFTEDLESEFGCITVNGKIVVGTDKFWQLQTIETSLLSFVINSQKNNTTSDIPIYLPNGSPFVPHRLITIKLIDNINVAIVCGPEPSLGDISNKYIIPYWSPLVPSLRECMRSIPRSFPPEVKLDENILGVLLLNLNDGHSLFSVHTRGYSTGSDCGSMAEPSYRTDALIKLFFTSNEIPNDALDKDEEPSVGIVKDIYQCFTTHKCYVSKNTNYEIYVLFSNSVPTYIMRQLTTATLKLLVKEK